MSETPRDDDNRQEDEGIWECRRCSSTMGLERCYCGNFYCVACSSYVFNWSTYCSNECNFNDNKKVL
jgi:hypothetical protein